MFCFSTAAQQAPFPTLLLLSLQGASEKRRKEENKGHCAPSLGAVLRNLLKLWRALVFPISHNKLWLMSLFFSSFSKQLPCQAETHLWWILLQQQRQRLRQLHCSAIGKRSLAVIASVTSSVKAVSVPSTLASDSATAFQSPSSTSSRPPSLLGAKWVS